ncbi:MAG TPA: bifunctional riboflavin kinase/FMN adenylyltransferase, partial [Clostridiaceae bacterium]|nr:bifunctional riboflavin kinase/FMN adenylyltransferase [Clostridiaceae bacterium]
MKIIKDNFENIQVDDKLAVALGTFDGLHWGHKKIINETVKYAKKNGIKSAVLTFDKIPIS